MKWRIPVIWEMTGIVEVEAPALEEAMSKVDENIDFSVGVFKDGSLDLECNDIETVRNLYNRGIPDGLESIFPELNSYDSDNMRTIPWVDDGSENAAQRENRMVQGMFWIRIVFEVCPGARFYCDIQALSVEEALGVFFSNHPSLTYNMVVDHLEV